MVVRSSSTRASSNLAWAPGREAEPRAPLADVGSEPAPGPESRGSQSTLRGEKLLLQVSSPTSLSCDPTRFVLSFFFIFLREI